MNSIVQLDLRCNLLTVAEAAISELVDRLDDLSIKADTMMIQNGTFAHDIYIQMSGTSQMDTACGTHQIISSCPVESPFTFGVMEALSGSQYNYSLKTTTAARFRVLPKEAMFSFLERDTASCYTLSKAVARHYMDIVRGLNVFK
jgi:hypothetical protein